MIVFYCIILAIVVVVAYHALKGAKRHKVDVLPERELSCEDAEPILEAKTPRTRSVTALVGSIVADVMLFIELRDSFSRLMSVNSTDPYFVAGLGLGLMLLLPHYLLFGIGCLLHWIGYSMRIRGLLLASAILYSAALLFGLQFFLTMLLPIILGYVGYANQLSLDRQSAAYTFDK